MKRISWIVLFYALLILVGGIIGHIKAGSQASLIMGVAFGLLLSLSAFLMFKGKSTGLYGAFVLTVLLDLFFTYRFVHTQQFLPAALLSIISLAMVIILGLKIKKSR